MTKQILLIFGILFTAVLQAQVEFGERYEQEHDWRKDRYLVISNEEEGVLLVQTDFDAAAKTYPMSFKHLNPDLEKVWEDTVRIPQRFFVKGYAYSGKDNFIMLQNNDKHTIKIIRINTQTRQTREYDSKEIAELEITEFEVLQNTAVIGGYFEERPVVVAYDMANNKVRTLPNVYQNQSALLEVKVNSDSLSFNVLASTQDDNKDQAVVVNTYDYEGNPLRDYTIRPKPEYDLLSGVSSSINDITQVVVGMYGYRSSYAVSGLYVNYVDRTGQQTMKYYNFGELPRFLDYMGEKRSTRLKNKTLSMKADGKEMRYKARASERRMMEKNGKLIFQGEFYRTFTQNNNQNNLNAISQVRNANNLNAINNGINQLGETSVIQERSVTHAYTLILDQEGNIEWDDFMEIDEDINGYLENFGSFNWFDNKASYAYYYDKELFIRLMTEKGNSETLTTKLALKEEGDDIRVERSESLGTLYWFDNKFLVYGVQHIRPADRSQPNRKVFFINQVTVTGDPIPAKEN